MNLSLVFPVYKKKDVVDKQVLRLYRELEKLGISFEFILVIDGIVDNTKQMLQMFVIAEELRNVKIVSYQDNMGKGYAVRYGMKYATGDIVGYTDADTDILPKTLITAYKAIQKKGVDMVAPSKLDPRSKFHMSLKRGIFSAGLRLLNRVLLRQPKNVRDISSGLKLFKREAAEILFQNMKVNRFAMDSELFYLAARNKLNVTITPLYLNGRSKSTSANIKQVFIMIRDIVILAIEMRTKELLELGSIALKPFRA